MTHQLSIHVSNWKANMFIAYRRIWHILHSTDLFRVGVTTVRKLDWFYLNNPASPPQCPDWPELTDEPWDVRIIRRSLRHYKQSMELSGTSPSGGAFPRVQDGGSMALGAGSTFSESSIFSAHPSQLIWNLVTRGLEAKMFLWSWKQTDKKAFEHTLILQEWKFIRDEKGDSSYVSIHLFLCAFWNLA